MPFTFDVRSMLEDHLVITMRAEKRPHLMPSAHQLVARLISRVAAESRDDGLDGEGADREVAEGADDGVDSAAHVAAEEEAAEEAEAARFESLMAADLAWFEGGQLVKGMADDHQLDALGLGCTP